MVFLDADTLGTSYADLGRFSPSLPSSAIALLEASFCERPGLIRRVIFQCPIWEAGEKGVLLGRNRYEKGFAA